MAHKIQILCLSTLNLINQRNVSHIKLLKYCDIDVRLTILKLMTASSNISPAFTKKNLKKIKITL